MKKREPELDAEIQPQSQNHNQFSFKQKDDEANSSKNKSKSSSLTQSEDLFPQKLSKQLKKQKLSKHSKVQQSENILVDDSLKKSVSKTETKKSQKLLYQLPQPQKIQQKADSIDVKEKYQEQPNFISKRASSQSNINTRSLLKSNIQQKSKPFYQETYYITGMKENYLLLLSDSNQVLEFPISLFATHAQNKKAENQEQQQNSHNEHFHLIKDIKIGQPIKIKLELDFIRQQKDEKVFYALQKRINQDCFSMAQQSARSRNKQVLIKRRK